MSAPVVAKANSRANGDPNRVKRVCLFRKSSSTCGDTPAYNPSAYGPVLLVCYELIQRLNVAESFIDRSRGLGTSRKLL